MLTIVHQTGEIQCLQPPISHPRKLSDILVVQTVDRRQALQSVMRIVDRVHVHTPFAADYPDYGWIAQTC